MLPPTLWTLSRLLLRASCWVDPHPSQLYSNAFVSWHRQAQEDCKALQAASREKAQEPETLLQARVTPAMVEVASETVRLQGDHQKLQKKQNKQLRNEGSSAHQAPREHRMAQTHVLEGFK